MRGQEIPTGEVLMSLKRNIPYWIGPAACVAATPLCMWLANWTTAGHSDFDFKAALGMDLLFLLWWTLMWLCAPARQDDDGN